MFTPSLTVDWIVIADCARQRHYADANARRGYPFGFHNHGDAETIRAASALALTHGAASVA